LVDVDVDEAPQLTLLVHEPLAQAGELALEVLHHVVDGLALGRHLGAPLGDRPQRGGNSNGHGHRVLLGWPIGVQPENLTPTSAVTKHASSGEVNAGAGRSSRIIRGVTCHPRGTWRGLWPLALLLAYGVAFASWALGASPIGFDDHPGQLYRA